jgi:tetratricopeptide (TPR) repeat protein
MIKLACLTIFASFIVLQPLVVQALTSEQIHNIAQLVTFKIKASSDGSPENEGSGVIISKQGNHYTIATNAHVVCNNPNPIQSCDKHTKYTVIAPDQQIYPIDSSAIKLLPNLDLAIIQFESKQDYRVAELGNSDALQINDPIYTAGFPTIARGFSFSHGTIIANVTKRLINDKGGYTVIYDASTNKGMSGGGVFNQQGQIIAIHGQGDRYKENTLITAREYESRREYDFRQDFSIDFNGRSLTSQKTGVNRGIPVKYLKEEKSFVATNSDNNTSKVIPSTADEWFVIALNKAIDPSLENLVKDTQEAIKACDKSIAMNSSYFMAYYIRGRLFERLNIHDKARNDYSAINKLLATSALQYIARSDAKIRVEIASRKSVFDTSSAFFDINEAIKLDSKYATAYSLRALIYSLQKNTSLAIKDLDQAINLDPFNETNFLVRALAKNNSSDLLGATADINQAVKIREANSEDVSVYRYYLRLINRRQDISGNNVGNIQDFIKPNSLTPYLIAASNKRSNGDIQGALQEYDKAIQYFPTAWNFVYRGGLKEQELKDYRGAEADFTSAINLRPNEPYFYMFRGIVRNKLMNKKEAFKDLQQAAAFAKKAGNEQLYSLITMTISTIK